jgi:hypothetical protein
MSYVFTCLIPYNLLQLYEISITLWVGEENEGYSIEVFVTL